MLCKKTSRKLKRYDNAANKTTIISTNQNANDKKLVRSILLSKFLKDGRDLEFLTFSGKLFQHAIRL